jgi:hypothetical protein
LSQGAVVINDEKRRLMADPARAHPVARLHHRATTGGHPVSPSRWSGSTTASVTFPIAVVGGFTLHPNYEGIDIDDTANVVTYSDGGETEHIVVPTEHLPLTQGLRDAGVDGKLVDAIDKPLRRRIDRAYDGPRPDKPAHAQRRNPIRAIAHAFGERREATRASRPD